MKNKGFTLLETIVAMGTVLIIIFTIGMLFSNNVRFRIALQDRIILATEARNAMYHMTRKLRFADPATVSIVSNPNLVNVRATIIGGYIKDNPLYDTVGIDRDIRYRWTKNGVPPMQPAFSVAIAEDSPAFVNWRVVGENIAFFSVQQGGGSNRDLTIELTSESEGKVFSLQTGIKVLGNM